ncbi:MAG: hypothetical protein OXE86_18770, partial [Alphaproteobacteria bacterium]|nr:hypothetical protein [Alphaproteobacteria bacterium]
SRRHAGSAWRPEAIEGNHPVDNLVEKLWISRKPANHAPLTRNMDARTRSCQFATLSSTLTARRGDKRAIVATAHKIALHVMVRDRVPYRNPGTDSEALPAWRNAHCWLRQLAQFGLLEEQGNGTFRVHWQARFTATNPARPLHCHRSGQTRPTVASAGEDIRHPSLLARSTETHQAALKAASGKV